MAPVPGLSAYLAMYGARDGAYGTRSYAGERGTKLIEDACQVRHVGGRDGRRGQSVVEFALIVPLLVILMVAIVDLARIYTTMVTIESAVREAADYATFGSQKWDLAVYSATDGTVEEMRHRACVASSTLPDYVGSPGPTDTDDCTNPTVTYELSGDAGANWVGSPDVITSPGPCDDSLRDPPCWLRVTLEYDFELLVPLNIDFFGVRLGLPTSLTFQRNAIFTMTDLELPPSPAPSP
jgi:hypothetical protein